MHACVCVYVSIKGFVQESSMEQLDIRMVVNLMGTKRIEKRRKKEGKEEGAEEGRKEENKGRRKEGKKVGIKK